jgi:predicted methyltransferase
VKELEVSLDLGLSKTRIKLTKEGFCIDGDEFPAQKIRDDDKSCYAIIDHVFQKLQFVSEDGKMYKLIPTSFRPILQISGTPMHKMQFIDRVEKDKLTGKIIDSGTGLGYTSIAAAKTADSIITVEMDPNVTEVAKLNPYSQELFTNSKIKRLEGDITEKIKKFKNSEFDNIIFDGGTPRSSGHFFSLENYKQAYRVLKTGGKLYHYLPQHQIQRGRDFGGEVIARMMTAGFKSIERVEKDSYAVATK